MNIKPITAKPRQARPPDYIKPAQLTSAQVIRADAMNAHVQRNPYGAARRLVWLEDRLAELQRDLAQANEATNHWFEKVRR